MNRVIRAILAASLAATSAVALTACGEEGAAASDLQIERLPDVQPNLPEVPQLPPPPHPVQLGDSSYTIYGVRHRIRNTMDTDVEVTGYIVEIYAPPECEEEDEDDCPPAAAPHLWIADTENESERGKRLTLVGYAENQLQIDEAREEAASGRYEPPDPETGLLPIPTDFDVGAKIKISGRFTRVSGTGFNISDGLIEYRGHETLQAAPGTETGEDS